MQWQLVKEQGDTHGFQIKDFKLRPQAILVQYWLQKVSLFT